MTKISKQKILSITVLLTLLLVSTAYASLVPFVHAAKPDIQDKTVSELSSELTSTEKTLIILKDVVGLDMAKYSTNLDSYSQSLYFEVLPQEDVKYTLKSDESKLEVICAFVNGKLRSMNTYADGSPHITNQAGNAIEMAKDFISKYQTISSASYYETLVPMLDAVEVNQNVTKTAENAKLEVTSTTSYTSFRWIYSLNHVDAPMKCVALNFESGFLKSFTDTWSLFTIGSTDMNISEEEAIRKATDSANNFSWNVSMGDNNPPVAVTEFNISGVSEKKLTFSNYATKNESRDGNPLTLYPGWRIKLYFDELYQGKVYGVDVGIWADTGEIYDVRTTKFLGDYSTDGDVNSNQDSIGLESNENANNESSSNIPAIAWATLIVTVLGATIVYSKRRKKISEINNGQKACLVKFSGYYYAF